MAVYQPGKFWDYWRTRQYTLVPSPEGMRIMVTDVHSGVVRGRVVVCFWSLERPFDEEDAEKLGGRDSMCTWRQRVIAVEE